MRHGTLAIVVVLACSDPKASPPPPLLGMKSDAVITHLNSSCEGRLSQDGVEGKGFRSDWIECNLQDGRSYRVRFDSSDHIDQISITGSESDALRVFDRAIAPIVPADVRESLRRSIGDPGSFTLDTKPGPCVDLIALDVGGKEAGASHQITWHLDECVRRSPSHQ